MRKLTEYDKAFWILTLYGYAFAFFVTTFGIEPGFDFADYTVGGCMIIYMGIYSYIFWKTL